jgi:hypothetical protein
MQGSKKELDPGSATLKKSTGCPDTNEEEEEWLPVVSLVQSVRLSLSSCMMRVESLYESSLRVSSSAIASSNA